MDKRDAKACLRAAYEASEPDRRPVRKSKTLKEAIARMEQEATELEEMASGHRPFSKTVRDIVERMK